MLKSDRENIIMYTVRFFDVEVLTSQLLFGIVWDF